MAKNNAWNRDIKDSQFKRNIYRWMERKNKKITGGANDLPGKAESRYLNW